MKVLILDGLGRPLALDASRVLVTTDAGTPVAAAVELGPALIDTAQAGDPDFAAKLRAYGIDRTVQVGTIRAPLIRDFDLRG